MTKEEAKNYFIATCYLLAGAGFGFLEIYSTVKSDDKSQMQSAMAFIAGIAFSAAGLLGFGLLMGTQARSAVIEDSEAHMLMQGPGNKVTGCRKLLNTAVPVLYLTGSVALATGSVDRAVNQQSHEEVLSLIASSLFILGSAAFLTHSLAVTEHIKKIADMLALVFFGPGSIIFLANALKQNVGKEATLMTYVEYGVCAGYVAANAANFLYRIFKACGNPLESDQKRLVNYSLV